MLQWSHKNPLSTALDWQNNQGSESSQRDLIASEWIAAFWDSFVPHYESLEHFRGHKCSQQNCSGKNVTGRNPSGLFWFSFWLDPLITGCKRFSSLLQDVSLSHISLTLWHYLSEVTIVCAVLKGFIFKLVPPATTLEICTEKPNMDTWLEYNST